jgi:LemA protein
MEVGMKKGMKVFLIVLAVVLLLIFSLYRFWAGNYNAMVQKGETVDAAWAQVQNQYQRRFDLIPNLVNTVKGYASHESEVFTNIAEARSRAGGVLQVSDEVFNNPESFARFQQAQNELGSALQRLLVITENYPELKADQNFLALQDQLEGTENRIGTERKRFNDVVRDYNTFIRQFPRVIIANMSDFTAKQYFAAGTEAQSAPQVQF